MPKNRSIIMAGLDVQSQSVIESCLPGGQFRITPVDPESGAEPHERADLVVFTATEDVRQAQQRCVSFQSRFGPSVPLLAYVGRYVYTAIRPLLETDLQGLIMTPFNAIEFREKLEQMELGS